MKAIMLMFDSLNRRMLSPYGCKEVETPNFDRLAGQALTFDNYYIGSMPCMPARRELHTGRYNFLHRAWGPLEPFDESMPELLKEAGVYTHLITDHYHYWEDGGAGYHTRYHSAEFVRGQEVDGWKAAIREPAYPGNYDRERAGERHWAERRNFRNRQDMAAGGELSLEQSYRLGLEFLEENHGEDNWFLTLECFDPHEPFHAGQAFREKYPHNYQGPHFDWPFYGPVREDKEMVEHCRNEANALYTMCDAYLGRILDLMDRENMWDDTMLIVNTDHGFLLGEHGWWAKNLPPCYDEIAHIPLFIWDPRCKKAGERRSSLVATIDIAPTLLDYFGLPPAPHMNGANLKNTISHDQKAHDGVLFGYFGQEINITDGRYVYMKAGKPGSRVYEYTLQPSYMSCRMPVELLQTAGISKDEFAFLKGCPVLKIPQEAKGAEKSLLYDLQTDPGQNTPLEDSAAVGRLERLLERLMRENEAPPEQLARFGIGEKRK